MRDEEGLIGLVAPVALRTSSRRNVEQFHGGDGIR